MNVLEHLFALPRLLASMAGFILGAIFAVHGA